MKIAVQSDITEVIFTGLLLKSESELLRLGRKRKLQHDSKGLWCGGRIVALSKEAQKERDDLQAQIFDKSLEINTAFRFERNNEKLHEERDSLVTLYRKSYPGCIPEINTNWYDMWCMFGVKSKLENGRWTCGECSTCH